MKKTIITLFLLFSFINLFKAQGLAPTDDIHYTCQVDGKAVADMNSASKIPQSTFPSSLIVTCAGGTFRLYYEDDYIAVTTGSAAGFADPLVGSARKNTYCAVLQYIKNTFDLNGQVLDIYVAKSFSSINPAPVTYSALGMAGSFFVPGTYGSIPGFFGGNFYQHVVTGTDPDPNEYDGMLTMTFDQLFNSPISYWDDYLNTTAPCKIDLYSVLLHETTHIMGWLSSLGEGPAPNYYLTVTSNASNIQSFTKFDQLFLWAGDVRTPGTFAGKKLVQGTSLNPTFVSVPSVLRNNQIWMNSNGAPNNHHTYDGSQPFVLNTTSAAGLAPKSFLSHLDYSNFSFYDACQHSPGFQPRYVMGQSMQANSMKREYTNAEFRYLNQLGYNYTAAFASSTSLSGGITSNSNLLSTNSAPYRSNIATTNIVAWPATTQAQIDAAHLFPETKPADFTITNNNAPGGPITTVFTINTHTLPNITDPNGQTIGIYPNSLYGIRGVTTGGNNHNSIVLTGSNTITYTPPPGYIGRAEFAFQLWDGIEAGARKMITIDVLPGAYTIPVGNELMINGGFEDATERKTFSNPNSPSSNVPGGDNLLINELNFGFVFHGGSPFGHMVNAQANWSGGVLRRESYQGCWIAPTFVSGTNTFGVFTTSFGSYMMGSSVQSVVPESCPTPPTNNECQIYFGNSIRNVFTKTLMNPLKTCKNYQFDFDISYLAGSGVSIGSVVTLTLNAISNITPNFTWPSVINFTNHQAIPLTFTVTAISTNAGNTNWQHVTANFFYCGTPTRYLLLNGPAVSVMDNLSLKELTTPPPPLIVTAINSSTLFCPGSTATLTGNAVNTTCSMTYTWQPMNIVSPTIVVTPPNINTTYTLFGNDGCRTGSAVVTPVPLPSGTFTAPAICIGNFSPYSLQSLIPVGTATNGVFTGTAIFNGNCSGNPCSYIDLTGNLGTFPPGVYNYTYSITNGSNCVQNYTFNVTFNPQPTNSISISPQQCLIAGQQVTLTAQPSPTAGVTYTWQPSGPNTSSIVVSPTVTTTYTLNSSNGICVNTKTVTLSVNPAITFTNLPTTWCTYQSIFYLENYLAAGTPTGGTWTIPNLGVITTPSPGLTEVNINPNLTTLGTHTVYYSYTTPSTTCTVNNQFTVNVVAGFNLNTNGQSLYCSNIGVGAPLVAIASPSTGVNYTWMPGFLSGANQTVFPASPTVYTVVANNGACTFSATTSVSVSNQCCSASNYFASNTINTGTFIGQYAINQNLTIVGNVAFGGEFRVAPNVSITVVPGATLTSSANADGDGLHMYSCTDMWHGIIAQNGGRVIFKYGDLIEDAKTAVYSNGCTNTSGTYDIWMNDVVFNRNYVAISINNYAQNTANPPFEIKSCVITCRDLNIPVGATSWPKADIATGLRATTTPVTPLSSPHVLNNYTPANLKAPYSNQPSYAGVYIENCGLTINPANVTPTYYNIIIGEKGWDAHSAYNIFDNQMHGIYGLNSNISSFDNVFQNSRRPLFTSPRPNYRGGYGIYTANNETNPNNYHSTLKMQASTTPATNNNTFYDCHFAVYGGFLHNVNANYVSIQSTRNSNASPVTTDYGQMGLQLLAINTKDYSLNYGTYKNLKDAVTLNVYWGNTHLAGLPTLANYLGQVDIKFNLFTPEASSVTALANGGIDNAITITNSGMIAGITFTQAGTNTRVQFNNLDRVRRGISNNGHSSSTYTGFSADNKITLVLDPFGNPQYGVYHVSAPASVVNTNTITGFNTTNALVRAIYASQIPNSAVQCNLTNTVYAGFDFNSSSPGVSMRNNIMTTNKRGLSLNNSGIIGTQGSWGLPHDNYWQGSWTGNNGTWVDGSSNAINSPLWVKTSPAGYNPPFNGGVVLSQNYGSSGTINSANNSANTSSLCSTPGNPPPSGFMAGGNNEELLNNIASDNMAYGANEEETSEINKILLYKMIDEENSLMNISDTLANFYSTAQQSAPGELKTIEQQFAFGSLSPQSLINNFSPSTNIQNNYKVFYSIYSLFLTNKVLSYTDSLDLLMLAHQCPFTDGPIIYRARALYDAINSTNTIYNDEACGEEGFTSRSNSQGNNSGNSMKQQLKSNEKKKIVSSQINYKIFPNPAIDEINIICNKENEKIEITVTDISGKVLLVKNLTMNNRRTSLKLDLLSGIYFVNLSNELGEKTVKKLVIAK